MGGGRDNPFVTSMKRKCTYNNSKHHHYHCHQAQQRQQQKRQKQRGSRTTGAPAVRTKCMTRVAKPNGRKSSVNGAVAPCARLEKCTKCTKNRSFGCSKNTVAIVSTIGCSKNYNASCPRKKRKTSEESLAINRFFFRFAIPAQIPMQKYTHLSMREQIQN